MHISAKEDLQQRSPADRAREHQCCPSEMEMAKNIVIVAVMDPGGKKKAGNHKVSLEEDGKMPKWATLAVRQKKGKDGYDVYK